MNEGEAISYANPIWDDFERDPNLGAECADLLYASHAAPRDFKLVENYIQDRLPAGDIYLYGAGTHSQTILPMLATRNDINLLGIVDMRAGATVNDFLGLKIIDPTDLKDQDFDYVLLSHTDREPEMAATLQVNNVADAKIHGLYGNQDYKGYAASHRQGWPDFSQYKHIDTFIISTTFPHNCLIQNELLLDIFPKDNSLELYMGRPTEWEPGDVYNKINLHQSLMILDQALDQLHPKHIYFRNTVQASMTTLPIYLRERYPNVQVLHETYDVGCFLEDKRMKAMWGFSNDTVRQARLGEISSFRYGDAFVHKNVGQLWEKFSSECEAKSLLYYPGIDSQGQDRPNIGTDYDTLNIVYPAGLSANGKVISPDIQKTLELLASLETVAETDGVNVHLYNHYHREGENDDAFQYYTDRYENSSIRYHPYVSHETLLSELSTYDFGWLYFEETPVFPRENLWRIGLPNKFTDYVQSGLPTIVSDLFECVAEVIEKYSAGIVIPTNAPGQIPEKIKSADIQALKEGTKHLLYDMRQGNQKTLHYLKQISKQNNHSFTSRHLG